MIFHATHLHVTQLGVRNLHLPPYAAQETKKGVVKSGHGAAHAATLRPWAVGLTAPAASSKPPARRFCFSFSSIRSSTWKILRNSGHSIVPLPEEGRRG